MPVFPRYACLLRGIDIGGHCKVAVKELLGLCVALGFRMQPAICKAAT